MTIVLAPRHEIIHKSSRIYGATHKFHTMSILWMSITCLTGTEEDSEKRDKVGMFKSKDGTPTSEEHEQKYSRKLGMIFDICVILAICLSCICHMANTTHVRYDTHVKHPIHDEHMPNMAHTQDTEHTKHMSNMTFMKDICQS